jgi:hypothetical protein
MSDEIRHPTPSLNLGGFFKGSAAANISLVNQYLVGKTRILAKAWHAACSSLCTPRRTGKPAPNPLTIRRSAMSTFHLVGMRSLRLTAMRIALIAAVMEVAAGVAVMLHQPDTIIPDLGTSEAASATMGMAVNPPQKNQGDERQAVHHIISSSLAKRSQVFF